MREMVLNHASLSVNDRYTALHCLKDIAQGMSSLNVQGIVKNELRMNRRIDDVLCVGDMSLYQAIFDLDKVQARDESRYLKLLTVKSPLLDSVSEPIEDRFSRCEATGCDAKTLLDDNGKPLVYCAITNGIAVGFPTDPVWDRDEVEVQFLELLDEDDDPLETSETIDNLSRPEHANAICERYRTYMRDLTSTSELWDRRKVAFSHLTFGPDVESHLDDLEAKDPSAIVKKLSIIDDCAAAWRTSDSAMPAWRGKITPESNSVRNNPTLYEARRFRSISGTREIFEWHARFSGGGRIHFRFDAQTKDVEIGYIGKHLPL